MRRDLGMSATARRWRRAAAISIAVVSVSVSVVGGAAAAPAAPGAPTIALGSSFDVAGTGELVDVACASPVLCVAVGANATGEGVVVAIRGGVADPPRPVAGVAYFSSVACGDAQHCVAVGGGPDGRVVAITGGVPGVAQPTAGIASVTCPTKARCYAVGADNVVTVINGVVSQATTTKRLPAMSSVSCVDAVTCVVVGRNPLPQGVHLYTSAFAVMRNGVVGAPVAIRTNQDVLFDRVTCAGRPYCYIGGSMLGTEGWAVRVDLRNRSQSRVLEEFELGSDDFTNASCPLVTRCVYAGGPALVLTTRGYFRLAGGAALPLPDERINALSCVRAATCVGVGSRDDASHPGGAVGWVQPFGVG